MLPLLFFGFSFFLLEWLSLFTLSTWERVQRECPGCVSRRGWGAAELAALPQLFAGDVTVDKGSESRASPPVPQGLQSQERGWTLYKAAGQRSGKAVMRSDHWFKPQEAHCRPGGHVHWHDSSSLCLDETEWEENQMGCKGAEDQHTTCPKACPWGGRGDRNFTCAEGTYFIVLMSTCSQDLGSCHVSTFSFLHTSDFELLSILNN